MAWVDGLSHISNAYIPLQRKLTSFPVYVYLSAAHTNFPKDRSYWIYPVSCPNVPTADKLSARHAKIISNNFPAFEVFGAAIQDSVLQGNRVLIHVQQFGSDFDELLS